MLYSITVCMYTAFERITLITKAAAFPTEGLAAVFVVRETSYKFPGQAVKTSVFSLPLSAVDFAKAMADRLDMRERAETFLTVDSGGHRSDRTPPPEEPSESPRHFAASMDESVIVGYYTLKKCVPRSPSPRNP